MLKEEKNTIHFRKCAIFKDSDMSNDRVNPQDTCINHAVRRILCRKSYRIPLFSLGRKHLHTVLTVKFFVCLQFMYGSLKKTL